MATKIERQTWADLAAVIGDANGAVIYEGPSRIDGAPIVVVAVGLWDASTNAKTGAMVQTYILRADVDPIGAVRAGADKSICGGCQWRGNGKDGTGRACYVTLAHGPRAVYASHVRGSYPRVSLDALHVIGRDKRVRLGTYGDPAAVPLAVWDALLLEASGWTGYTHQWRSARLRDVLRYCQASCDAPEDVALARQLGAGGTFRVGAAGDVAGMLPGEVLCPASAEAGKVTTCDKCRMCAGATGATVYIPAHGTGAKYVSGTGRRALAVLA